MSTNKGCDQKGNLLPNASQHRFIFEIIMKVKLEKWPITKHYQNLKTQAKHDKKNRGPIENQCYEQPH